MDRGFLGRQVLATLERSLPTYNGRERPPLRIGPPAGAPHHITAVKLRLFSSAADLFLPTILPGMRRLKNSPARYRARRSKWSAPLNDCRGRATPNSAE